MTLFFLLLHDVKINSRCSVKKLRHLINDLTNEKKSVIEDIGFGGLLYRCLAQS